MQYCMAHVWTIGVICDSLIFQSFICSFIHSFIYLLIYSFIHLLPPQTRFAKLMFSQVSVILSTGGGLHPGGGLYIGGSASRGICILVGGGVGQTPHWILQDTSNKRRYSSYWNTFLFVHYCISCHGHGQNIILPHWNHFIHSLLLSSALY